MVKITRVYTRTGDKGATSLAAGIRVAKTSVYMEAIGNLDELNAFLGIVQEVLARKPSLKKIKNKISRIQNELFDLGAQLVILKKYQRKNSPRISLEDIQRLENEIEEMNKTLPFLKSFILPGGGEIVAKLHVARTVCRRAERSVIALSEIKKISDMVVPYLNRLSDWLFVTARFVTAQLKQKEILWEPGKRNFK